AHDQRLLFHVPFPVLHFGKKNSAAAQNLRDNCLGDLDQDFRRRAEVELQTSLELLFQVDRKFIPLDLAEQFRNLLQIHFAIGQGGEGGQCLFERNRRNCVGHVNGQHQGDFIRSGFDDALQIVGQNQRRF